MTRDLNYAFAHVERGPLAFAWALLTRPGHVAREYVEGKRRRHYGPFATLVVLVGVTTLAINLLGFQITANDRVPTEAANFLRQHFNLLLLVQLPLLGAICLALFRSARLNLTEHMVLVAYALSVRAVVLALLATAAYLTSKPTPSPGSNYAFWTAWCIYFGWASSQFYDGRRLVSWAKGAVAGAVGGVAVIAAIGAGNAVYFALFVR